MFGDSNRILIGFNRSIFLNIKITKKTLIYIHNSKNANTEDVELAVQSSIRTENDAKTVPRKCRKRKKEKFV